jgi:hypothetical protein
MVFYIPFLESQIRIINSQFDLGLERISKVNLIILLIIPILNLLLILFNLFINKYLLEIASFRFRNKLMRHINKSDLII